MSSDAFLEFVEEAVEEEAEAMFGAMIDACYSSAHDDAYQDIQDELESHREQAGWNTITDTEARECIRTALLQCQRRMADDVEAL